MRLMPCSGNALTLKDRPTIATPIIEVNYLPATGRRLPRGHYSSQQLQQKYRRCLFAPPRSSRWKFPFPMSPCDAIWQRNFSEPRPPWLPMWTASFWPSDLTLGGIIKNACPSRRISGSETDSEIGMAADHFWVVKADIKKARQRSAISLILAPITNWCANGEFQPYCSYRSDRRQRPYPSRRFPMRSFRLNQTLIALPALAIRPFRGWSSSPQDAAQRYSCL